MWAFIRIKMMSQKIKMLFAGLVVTDLNGELKKIFGAYWFENTIEMYFYFKGLNSFSLNKHEQSSGILKRTCGKTEMSNKIKNLVTYWPVNLCNDILALTQPDWPPHQLRRDVFPAFITNVKNQRKANSHFHPLWCRDVMTTCRLHSHTHKHDNLAPGA